MNEYAQDVYIDLGVGSLDIGVVVQSEQPGWVQPSSSTYSLLGLPEMALQPSISSEVELLDKLAADPQQPPPPPAIRHKRKARDVEKEDVQSEVGLSRFCQGANMGLCCSKDETVDQIKRTRTAEVHTISERRRRDNIKAKMKALQELIPHCRKKDRVSILEDAANYLKALKLQVETMVKAREGEFLAQYMPFVGTPGMQVPSMLQSVPIRPGLGAGVGMAYGSGVCAGCLTPCGRWIHLPPTSGVHPFPPSMLPGFPFPTMCPPAVPTADGNCTGETKPCTEVQGQQTG